MTDSSNYRPGVCANCHRYLIDYYMLAKDGHEFCHADCYEQWLRCEILKKQLCNAGVVGKTSEPNPVYVEPATTVNGEAP